MRVVFLTHNYPRWPGDYSGAALAALGRALIRRGVSVQVVAPGEDSAIRTELHGVTIQRVKVSSRLAGMVFDQEAFAARLSSPSAWELPLRIWRGLREAARQELARGADLIHAHCWMPAGFAAPAGVPVVLTAQGTDSALLRRSRLARWLARPLFRRVTLVSAVSRSVGEAIQNLSGRFIPPEHIHPLPIDSREFSWTRGGGGAVLAARLDHLGRVELALQTVAVLASYGHQLPLTIIGEGHRLAGLQQQARKLGIAALVRFLGPMAPDQARTYLARADLMLLTARGATSSVAAQEALVSGVPVVACWDGGAPVDVVPQSGAGRLSLPSAEALAEAVLSLKSDKNLLAAGRLVGESWRTRLAPENVAQVYEGWYRDALGR